MDAAALLRAQGWRGEGHTLHPADNAIGLARPLLLRRNTDGRGVGQVAAHYTSDQWWLRAFDEKLKGLSTGTVSGGGAGASGGAAGSKMVQTVVAGRLDAVSMLGRKRGAAKYGSLYASFVRGEGMEGTITPASETETTTTETTGATTPMTSEDGVVEEATTKRGKTAAVTKRAREDEEEEEGKRGKQRKQSRKEGGETKEERRARREVQRMRRAEKEKKKEIKQSQKALGLTEAVRTTAVLAEKKSGRIREKKKAERANSETREERRARRAARRARKEERRKKLETSRRKEA